MWYSDLSSLSWHDWISGLAWEFVLAPPDIIFGYVWFRFGFRFVLDNIRAGQIVIRVPGFASVVFGLIGCSYVLGVALSIAFRIPPH